MIYYTLFFLLTFLSFIYNNKVKCLSIQYTYILFVVFLFFIFVAGGRDGVGTDWEGYERVFRDYVLDPNYTHKSSDFLFYGLNKVISKFSNSFHVFVLVLFFISFLLKYIYLIKLSPNVFLSLIIYLSGIFLIFDINGLRQGLAFSFILISCKYVFDRKFLKFSLFVFMAGFCHNSALIFLPAYFLLNVRLSCKQYIFYSLLFSLVGYMISNYISDLVLLSDNESSLADKYEYYASGNVYITKVTFFSFSTFRRFFLWGVILCCTKDIHDKSVYFYKNCLLVSFFFYFLFSTSLEVAYRISYYFFCFEIVLIPLCLFRFSHLRQRNILLTFFLIYYFYMIYKLVSDPTGGLYIYNNIFV